MAVVGSIGDISNIPIKYIPAKTRADKFVEKLNLSESSSKTITNIKFTEEINTSDKFNEDPAQLLLSKVSKNFEKPYSATNMGVKTTAKNKLELIEKGFLEKELSGFGFVEIEEETTTPITNIISDNIPKAQDIKRMSFINKLNTEIDTFNFKGNIKDTVLKKILQNIGNLTYKEDPKEVVVDYLEIALNETIADLIKGAELAESMINFGFTSNIDLELNFLSKLREVITQLENSIKEVQKLEESKKKESKVEVKIKRFDIRDIQSKKKLI